MNLLKRHPILAFYLLTLLISWPIKIPISLGLTSNILLRFLPSLMPAVAALVIAALIAGKHGVSALLRQLSPAGTSLWLYAAVLIGPNILGAIALGINLLLGQPAPQWINPGLRLLTFLPGLFFAITEELGWRGFVLPRLQARTSALTSSLILGLLWACWHFPETLQAIPLHLSLSETLSLQGISLLQFLALSILMTWTFNSSKGRIAAACILHVSSQVLPRFWPDAYSQPLTTFSLLFNILLGVAALVLLLLLGATNLSREPRTMIEPEAETRTSVWSSSREAEAR
jgi:membrane protease YdiL (CAAX protease family)